MSHKELREAGLKVTAPRMKILQIMEEATANMLHMSAEDVFRKLLEDDSDIGLATVYRVLTQFESAGLVERHNFEDGHAVFEMTSEEHHDHMVCLDSGEVIEFFNEAIEKLQHEIAESHGYELMDHSLVLYVKKKKAP